MPSCLSKLVTLAGVAGIGRPSISIRSRSSLRMVASPHGASQHSYD
jgi:hypothetical protein